MVRNEYVVETREQMRGGNGTVTIQNWMEQADLPPHVRMISTIVLPVGASIGTHVHEGEAEMFCILSGAGEYNDNGSNKPVKQGDVLVCYSGETHGISNTGNSDLVVTAAVVTE